MATYSFVALTYYLADCIGILGTLSKVMQRKGIEYSEIKPQIEAAITALKKLQTAPEPYFKEVEQLLPEEPDDSGYSLFKSHDIKDSVKERKKFKDAVDAFTEALLLRLEQTYPDSHLMEPFLILNPSSSVCAEDREGEAIEKLERLLNRYNNMIATEAAHNEWILLREIMRQDRFKIMNMAGFFQTFLHPNRDSYPHLALLAAIGLTIPVTSVDCERGVSRYNAIKTDSRSSLTVNHVNTLMIISLEGKDLQNFDFKAAFDWWLNYKDRSGYLTMIKKAKKAKLSSTPVQITDQSCEMIPLDLTTMSKAD